MLKKSSANGWIKICLIITAILSITLTMAFFTGYFDSAHPEISGIKIIKEKNMLTVTYKSLKSKGPENEVIINWYFNGVEQPQFKGLSSIPAPAITNLTVEIECAIRTIEGTTVSKAVMSKKYRHYIKNEAGLSPSAASPLTTYEIRILNARRMAKNAANTHETNLDENIFPPGSIDISTDAIEFLAAVEEAKQPAASKKHPRKAPASVQELAASNVETGSAELAAFLDQNTDAIEITKAETDSAKLAEADVQNTGETTTTNKFGTGSGIYFKSNSTTNTSGNDESSIIASNNTVSTNTNVTSSETINNVKNKWKSLQEAILNNDFDMARLMINSGYNVNAADKNGLAPIHMAVLVDSIELVSLLLRNNADISARDNNARTPLHIAAAKKSTKTALFLLENDRAPATVEVNLELAHKNKLVNLTDKNNRTPLHIAAMYDAYEIALILILNGADINAKDSKKAVPLHYALMSRSEKTISVLIENGADTNMETDKNMKKYLLEVNSLIESPVKCKTCNGIGNAYGRVCKDCGGDGIISTSIEKNTSDEKIKTTFVENPLKCKICKGTGNVYGKSCKDCGGSGVVPGY